MGPASRIGVGATPRRWLASSFASWEGLHGAPPRRSGVRSNQLECGEVGSIAGRVAGEELIASDRGMGADVEVGKRRPPCPAGLPIVQKGLSRQEASLVRQGFAAVETGGQRLLERLDRGESDRHL